MTEPIKVGDLVMVVRSHCGQHIGEVHLVTDFGDARDFDCSKCGKSLGALTYAVVNPNSEGRNRLCWPPLSWLKRIPPLGELNDVKQDEEITA